jgi:phosphoglycerate dehydrogenase-like enzyme
VVEENWESMSETELADRIREFDVLVLSRQPNVPRELAANPGNLKYINYMHGGVKGNIGLPFIQSPIKVTNWGDHTGVELSEGALALLICCLKDVHHRIMRIREGMPRDAPKISSVGGRINGLRVGVYGYGLAGKAFVRMIDALGADVRIFDPYAKDLPESCTRVDSLEELFDDIHAIVIHAALTGETRHSVSKELLAKLPDHGIVVNTARGAIIDQEALFAELKSGRLRAGLDVLDPDHLPVDHEARQWENLIYGNHCFSQSKSFPGEERLERNQEVMLENLRAFAAGEPLNYVITEDKFKLMT